MALVFDPVFVLGAFKFSTGIMPAPIKLTYLTKLYPNILSNYLSEPDPNPWVLSTSVRVIIVLIIGFFQVGLWIDAGSRYENERNNGTAHFLEHMAFKVSCRCSITAVF